MFAKIFNTELGQILIKKDRNDDGDPEVRLYFEPEGLGVCSLAMSTSTLPEEEQWQRVDTLFDEIDEGVAVEAVAGALQEIASTVGDC